ncbi:MAG: sugar phosphate isomerase/epimerase and 4-hydroxyphenylpyruvate domain-containing protein [Rhodospirillaceae bacterium]|jgi:4-hydroxyphenylpyruvate dioxygenase|nr:sugar phosphate isomerase/epimerase and 4-hydroxyphenylpyruvate domain-containing protein [Rhodospirillaceae bacterium]
MYKSIATVSLSGTMSDKLEAISAAGFEGVEIFEDDFLAFDGTPKELGNIVRDFGMDISLFQPFRDFEGMPEPHRTRAFDRAERKFDVMEELGTDLILICSNLSEVSVGGIDRAAADLRELGDRAAARGLRVGYEALAWGRHINDYRDSWEIVRRADHPNVGIILDSFHILSRRLDVAPIRSIPADRIFFVQLADAPMIDMDLLYWSRHFRNMPGEGDMAVTDFMRAVVATGYDGPVSLEIFNDQFRGGFAKTIAVDGCRSLVNLIDEVKNAEPDSKIIPPSMPPKAIMQGIEFVEFAANDEGEADLTDLFQTLGFAHAGKHIAKDVAVWRQGGINLVINKEKPSFAHSSYVLRGTSVCDIGVMVDDAEAAITRATALGVQLFSQETGPGELKIPAIRGVGGSILHFLDQKTNSGDVWDIEFNPLAHIDADADRDAGLVRIDHLAQTMGNDQMASWALFYSSIFDAERGPMFDVIDPGGLVRSQAIEGRDGNVRITMNGVESGKTLAGQFAEESAGSAVQHIAFLSDDIFAAAERLRSNGFETLEISRNYYDDLEARFGLDAELADQLRDNNLLYDRDNDGGEYFQLYSRTFGSGFFFEVVERRGGYAGYGAMNAKIRIAAQKRLLRKSYNFS